MRIHGLLKISGCHVSLNLLKNRDVL